MSSTPHATPVRTRTPLRPTTEARTRRSLAEVPRGDLQKKNRLRKNRQYPGPTAGGKENANPETNSVGSTGESRPDRTNNVGDGRPGFRSPGADDCSPRAEGGNANAHASSNDDIENDGEDIVDSLGQLKAETSVDIDDLEERIQREKAEHVLIPNADVDTPADGTEMDRDSSEDGSLFALVASVSPTASLDRGETGRSGRSAAYVSELESQVEDMAATNLNLQKEMANLDDKFCSMANENASLWAIIDDLTSNVDTLEKEVVNDNDNLRATVDTLKKEVAILKNKVSSANNENAKLTATNANLTATVHALEEVVNLKEEVSNRTNDNTSLSAANAGLNSEAHTLEEEVANLEYERDKKSRELVEQLSQWNEWHEAKNLDLREEQDDEMDSIRMFLDERTVYEKADEMDPFRMFLDEQTVYFIV